MQPLCRSAFAAHLLSTAGALLAIALGTLHFETAGGAVGYSTPVAVGLLALLVLRILWLSFLRALDAGTSVPGALAAVVGTLVLAPFVTLALLALPSAVRPDGSHGAVASPAWVVLALPFGGAVGGAVLLLVQAIFKAL
jgi:hypothetical protein